MSTVFVWWGKWRIEGCVWEDRRKFYQWCWVKVNVGTFGISLFLNIIDILTIFSIDSHDEDEALSLGQPIRDAWMRRKSCLDHDDAVTGYYVACELNLEHNDMIERVVEQLHHRPLRSTANSYGHLQLLGAPLVLQSVLDTFFTFQFDKSFDSKALSHDALQ